VPTIGSFEGAELTFNMTKPWRDRNLANQRPLDQHGRRKIHMRLVKTADTYECTLYKTPLVVYHRDGRVTLRSYATRSSNAFANAVLPQGVSVDYGDCLSMVQLRGYLGSVPYPEYTSQTDWREALDAWSADQGKVQEASRVYQMKGSTLDIIKRDGKWEILDLSRTEPWQKRKLDMPRYNQLLKSVGYDEFRLWYKAAHALQGMAKAGWKIPTEGYFEALKAGPERWTELELYNHPNVLKLIREDIVRKHSDMTVVTEEKPYIPRMWDSRAYIMQAERFGGLR